MQPAGVDPDDWRAILDRYDLEWIPTPKEEEEE